MVIDADIRDFAPHFVVGLVGPLLTRSDISFVKGFYDRPVEGSPHGGGRVTELMARPVIAASSTHAGEASSLPRASTGVPKMRVNSSSVIPPCASRPAK